MGLTHVYFLTGQMQIAKIEFVDALEQQDTAIYVITKNS